MLTGLRRFASWLLAFDPWRARSCSDDGGGITCGREAAASDWGIDVLR